jgi:hypothetical protein
MHPLRLLLEHSIDYAGLFPPAGLAMRPALENYAAYRAGPDAWALGRFVVPAARLDELVSAAGGLLPAGPDDPWRLSVLLGSNPAGDVRRLGELNCRHAASGAGALVADIVELKADSADAAETELAKLPRHLTAFVELPVARDPGPALAVIARHGAGAKVRTGGVTADAFPITADLLRFLRAAVSAGVPFKATAGLHHPIRAIYRLTYEPDSPSGTMYGFLNLFLAAAFLRQGMSDADAARLLEESDPASLQVDSSGGGVGWRGHRLDAEALVEARARGLGSFGSCSFEEPIGDLASLHLL